MHKGASTSWYPRVNIESQENKKSMSQLKRNEKGEKDGLHKVFMSRKGYGLNLPLGWIEAEFDTESSWAHYFEGRVRQEDP